MSETSAGTEEIRVQYSGLVIFAVQIVSLVTGLAFNLLLTRNLTKLEYGTYTNIFDVISYFTIFASVFPFWATRFVARGKVGAIKVVVGTNFAVSMIAMVVYLALLLPITSGLGVGPEFLVTYAFASVHIINVHLVAAFEGVLRAKKPQVLGFGLLISEVAKVILAYVFVFIMGQVFLAALLGFLIGGVLQLLYYLKLVAPDLRTQMHWHYIREWTKGSIASIVGLVGSLFVYYVFILLFVYGGHGTARADYQAAVIFASVITYASSLAAALYPKLVAKSCFEEVASTLRLVLLFALPMTVIGIVMSSSLLTILDVSYSSATPVLIVLIIDGLVGVLITFYQNVYMGAEKLDEEAKIHLGTLLKSKIFRANLLPFVQAAITLSLVVYVLTSLTADSSVIALYFALAILVSHVVMLGLLYIWTIKSCKVAFPWVSVSKYLFSSIVTGVVLFFLPHPTTLMLTFGLLALGAGIYVGIILVIDGYARNLVRKILEMVLIGLRITSTKKNKDETMPSQSIEPDS
jgi:O-antigen/teichoic acid export membrane protein